MRIACLSILAICLSSCTITGINDHQSGVDYAATTGPQKQLSKKHPKTQDSPEVQHRAESYENQGYSSEEALALARIEHSKSAQ